MKKFSFVVLAVLAMSCLFSCANDSSDSVEAGYYYTNGVGTCDDSSKITFIQEDGDLVALYKKIGVNVVLTFENDKNITLNNYSYSY